MPEAAEITRQRVVLKLPGSEAVQLRRDLEGRFDLYTPRGSVRGAGLPGLVFVSGYPDSGMQRVVGRKHKEWAATQDWARLAAASGLAAITYSAEDPAADATALLERLRANADALGLDPERLGLWASSGNVPTALSLLLGAPGRFLKCAVLLYGYTLDLDGATGVADAAKTFGFANPCTGRSPAQLPPRTPLLVLRAGRDVLPGLNDALDRFVAHGLAANLPLELVNLPDAPHGFDSADDSEPSRAAIRRVLAFAADRI